MIQPIITGLLWFCAIGCGLIAGLYFSFSTFIMTAFAGINQASGIAAMNAINVVIQRSLFMPFFAGTTLACLTLAAFALFRWSEAGSLVLLTGSLIYVIGMFVCTMVMNVPLNNALAAVADPASAEAAKTWAIYLKDWTFWNHVRTFASIAGSAASIYALIVR